MGLGSFIKKVHDPFGHQKKVKKELSRAAKKAGLDDMLAFEKNNLKYMWDALRADPERAFIGALEPFSSKMWGEIVGKDYEPIQNQLGGPSKGSYADAAEKGIDISPSAGAHQVAAAIASWYAGGAGAAMAPASVPITTAQGAAIVGAGAAVADEELDPLEDVVDIDTSYVAAPSGLYVPQVKTLAGGGLARMTERNGTMPSKSPAQARLMRAAAHGWKKPGGGGPSQAVGREFMNADRGYSNGGSVDGGYTFKQLVKHLDGGIGSVFRIMRGLEDGTYIKDPNTELIYMREPTGIESTPVVETDVVAGVQGPRSGRGPRGGGRGNRGGGGGGPRGGGGGGGPTPDDTCPSGYRGRLGNCRPNAPPGGGGGPRVIPGGVDPVTGGPPTGGDAPPTFAPPPSPAVESEYSLALKAHNARIKETLGYAEGGEVRPGHPEGVNPYNKEEQPGLYALWERKYHKEPAPPPPPLPEAEELSWLEKLMGKKEASETRTERELEEMEQARGGRVNYAVGGLAAMAPPGRMMPPRGKPMPPPGMRPPMGGPPRGIPPMGRGRGINPPNPYMNLRDPNAEFSGGPKMPPSMQGHLQKARMMDRPRRGFSGPAGAGGPPGNRVGMQDQQGGLARALQKGTGRPPMSRRSGFPGSR